MNDKRPERRDIKAYAMAPTNHIWLIAVRAVYGRPTYSASYGELPPIHSPNMIGLWVGAPPTAGCTLPKPSSHKAPSPKTRRKQDGCFALGSARARSATRRVSRGAHGPRRQGACAPRGAGQCGGNTAPRAMRGAARAPKARPRRARNGRQRRATPAATWSRRQRRGGAETAAAAAAGQHRRARPRPPRHRAQQAPKRKKAGPWDTRPALEGPGQLRHAPAPRAESAPRLARRKHHVLPPNLQLRARCRAHPGSGSANHGRRISSMRSCLPRCSAGRTSPSRGPPRPGTTACRRWAPPRPCAPCSRAGAGPHDA